MNTFRSFVLGMLIVIVSALLLRSVASPTATGADAQTAKEPPTLAQLITSLERKELDAIKDGNLTLFSDLLADDAVFLNSRGFGDKALVVKNTSAFKLTEYSMDDGKVVPLSTNSGLIAYKLTEKGNAHGQEISGQVYASAVWAERGGKWVCLFSQETPAK
jgi:hypothetical protein